jgi:uncharacterized protein YoxC
MLAEMMIIVLLVIISFLLIVVYVTKPSVRQIEELEETLERIEKKIRDLYEELLEIRNKLK